MQAYQYKVNVFLINQNYYKLQTSFFFYEYIQNYIDCCPSQQRKKKRFKEVQPPP